MTEGVCGHEGGSAGTTGDVRERRGVCGSDGGCADATSFPRPRESRVKQSTPFPRKRTGVGEGIGGNGCFYVSGFPRPREGTQKQPFPPIPLTARFRFRGIACFALPWIPASAGMTLVPRG